MAELRADRRRHGRAAEPPPGCEIVTGDTKVVNRGAADGLYITTAGVGRDPRRPPARSRAGAARRRHRHLRAPSPITGWPSCWPGATWPSKPTSARTRPRWPVLVETLLAAAPATRWLRDPTRGGLGTVCNELARATDLAVVLDEASLPIDPAVNGACDLLGIDPLYVANEGKFVAVVAARRDRRRPRRPAGPPPRERGGPHRRGARRPRRDRGAAHRFRRDPHRRHARRRSPAPHLLMTGTSHPRSGAGCGSRAPSRGWGSGRSSTGRRCRWAWPASCATTAPAC